MTPLMTEQTVARALNISVATLRRWRLLNTGPKVLKIGASVRYREDDLKEWLDSSPTIGGKHTEGK